MSRVKNNKKRVVSGVGERTVPTLNTRELSTKWSDMLSFQVTLNDCLRSRFYQLPTASDLG